jgi:hypothetical protein
MEPRPTNHDFPDVLLEREVVSFLRLDEPGGPRNPSATLRRYRALGLLKAIRISRSQVYLKTDVLAFVARLAERGAGR